jgi:hypothetical protein
MQSVLSLLAEAIEKLKSMQKAAHEAAVKEVVSNTASAAATFERKQAVEDARSKVANLWDLNRSFTKSR